jgi:hypothetical protein
MGNLPMPVGVRCRSCGTGWPTIAALSAGQAGSAQGIEPVEGLDEPFGGGGPKARGDSFAGPVVATIAAVGAGVALAFAGLPELAFILVGAAMLAIRALAGRRRRT